MRYTRFRERLEHELGDRLVFGELFMAVEADITLAAGQVEEALRKAEAVLGPAIAASNVFAAGFAQRLFLCLGLADLGLGRRPKENPGGSLRTRPG